LPRVDCLWPPRRKSLARHDHARRRKEVGERQKNSHPLAGAARKGSDVTLALKFRRENREEDEKIYIQISKLRGKKSGVEVLYSTR